MSSISIESSKGMGYEGKPYRNCRKCPHLGVRCEPPILGLAREQVYAWCRDMKQDRGWSNEKLAEEARTSKTTINRILLGSAPGLNAETLSSIVCALLYGEYAETGEWTRYPCIAKERATIGCADCEELERQLQKRTAGDRVKIDFLKQQVTFAESQLEAKDRQLDQNMDIIRRKDRAVVVLAVLLGLSVILILAAMVIDLTNPELGFIWMSRPM